MLALVRATPNLTSISLNACQSAGTDAVVQGIAAACPHLTSASFYWCVRLGDAGVRALAERCPALTVLNLSGCRNLTDAGAAHIAKLTSLVDLNLTRCGFY